jgi:hypothetical protein
LPTLTFARLRCPQRVRRRGKRSMRGPVVADFRLLRWDGVDVVSFMQEAFNDC